MVWLLITKRTKVLSNEYSNVTVDIKVDLEKDINLKVSFEEVKQLGIVINELITNIFKHAFVDNHSPSIIFRAIMENENLLIVQLSDNGIGINLDSMSKTENSFGLKMVTSICEQLDWTLKMKNLAKGAAFSIKINL